MRDLEFDIKARDGTAAAFDSARANARGFNHARDLTARGFNLAATAAKGFAVGFAVSSLAEFGSVVRRTISDAADLVDMADKVGVSTENIQRMVYGFGQAGVASEDIDKILTQWAKRIGEAYTKGGQLADIARTPGAQFNVNTATGVVTFTAGNIPPNGHVVRAGFEFDVPARFDDDALSVRLLHANAGDIVSIPIVEIRP